MWFKGKWKDGNGGGVMQMVGRILSRLGIIMNNRNVVQGSGRIFGALSLKLFLWSLSMKRSLAFQNTGSDT